MAFRNTRGPTFHSDSHISPQALHNMLFRTLKITFRIALVILLTAEMAWAELRTWTDVTGKHRIEAVSRVSDSCEA